MADMSRRDKVNAAVAALGADELREHLAARTVNGKGSSPTSDANPASLSGGDDDYRQYMKAGTSPANNPKLIP